MSDLDEERKQFTSQVRDEFIELINQQVKLEEKSRQYKLIFQFAEKYKQGDAKSIHEFIDSEKKIAEKDKNSVRTQGQSQRTASESINSRKNFIPMLELEYCILTTGELPKSLFPDNFSESKSSIENLQIDFNSSKQEQSEIDKIFNTSFQCNVIQLSKVKDSKLKEITHAHVVVACLSFYPKNWRIFLEKFKTIYIKSNEKRYSFLHFITTWFEMRPKHFLKMFPYLIDLIEECDDGDLLIKHLKIIFDVSKRNMYFRFLPLDSVPHKFKLNYIQTSDYHKLISGTDVTTMQNSFKSNMLKRFDFANSKFCGDTKGDKSNEKPNDNSNQQPTPGSGKNKNKKKGNNNPASKQSNTQPPKQNTNTNETTTEPSAAKKEDYPQQPNLQDFVDAILILITTVQNALSFDFFIPPKTIDENIIIKDENEEHETIYDKMDSIKLQETKNLKYLFTESEFSYWKEKIKSIEVAHEGIQKLSKIFDGCSNWIVEVLNNQRADSPASQNVFKTILNNYKKLYEEVSNVDVFIANRYLTINLDELRDDISKALKDQNIFKDFEKYRITKNDSKTQNDENKKDQSDILDRFLREDQINYKIGHKIIVDKESQYEQLLDITVNILSLLNIKPTLDNKVHMEGYLFEAFTPKSESKSESKSDNNNNNSSNNQFDTNDDKIQQYVDPWAIRIIFYNFTRFIFDPKYKDLNFKFEV